MTAKYHISPSTGRPNQCHAKNCPFGDESDHYETKESAREAFEKQMQGETLTSVSKTSNVTSLSEHREDKLATKREALDDTRAATNFDQAWSDFPKYELNKAEQKIIEDVAGGKKISDEKLDLLIEDKNHLTNKDSYNSLSTATAARGVIDYLRAVRAQSNIPSTLKTLSSFDPANETMFSNPRARTNATIAGKALRRENAHAEWLYELAAEQRKASKYFGESDDSGTSSADYIKTAERLEYDAIKSDAKVRAQLRELQYLYDNDPAYANTANSDVQRMLSKGYFRGGSSEYDSVPIGSVRKVKK